MAGVCSSSFGQQYAAMVKQQQLEDTKSNCIACWHLDVFCYEGCEGHGTANGLLQPTMEQAGTGRKKP